MIHTRIFIGIPRVTLEQISVRISEGISKRLSKEIEIINESVSEGTSVENCEVMLE